MKITLLLFLFPLYIFALEEDADTKKKTNIVDFTSQVSRSFFSMGSNQLYKSVDSTMKSAQKAIQPTVKEKSTKVMRKKVVQETKKLNREEQIKKQFISKQELLKSKDIEKEIIQVDNESASFFESLNKRSKKPINME